jgi:glutamine synthetase
MPVKDALEMAKKNKAEIVDLKFIDLPGLWQHFSIPASQLNAGSLKTGWDLTARASAGFRASTNPT